MTKKQKPISENDTEIDEEDFIDINIASPSTDAAYYGYDVNESKHSLSLIKLVIVAIMIIITTGSLTYVAYLRGIKEGQNSLPPLIKIGDAPQKIKPPINNKEIKLENNDLNIYDVMTGNTKIEEMIINPPDSKKSPPLITVRDAPQKIKPPINNKEIKLENNESNSEEVISSQSKKQPPQVKMQSLSSDDSAYIVQLSASPDENKIHKEYEKIFSKNKVLLEKYKPLIKQVSLKDKGIFFRLNIIGFSSKEEAQSLCQKLKQARQDCLVRKYQ